jgi:predicted transposase/invertase (TIGR01784 family)
LANADTFGEYMVDFRYILIDVNRYKEADLWELANLIGGVFLLDQAVAPEIYHQRIINLEPILRHYNKPVMDLFFNWFVTVVCRDLSDENKAEVVRKLQELNPEEAEQVVSNMAQTWRKMYDNARMEGLKEGKVEGEKSGEKKTTIKHVKSMLLKDINEELIAEITGLTLEEIQKLRKEMEITIGKSS